jgi:regulator of telomere elongation helicase 1
MCRAKTTSRTCSHQIRLEETRGERMAAGAEMRDIEDLVRYGQETRACPYYLAREDQEDAEITVLPYNYLFDSSMRRAQKIDISGAVVIVDEAHNLEKHAEETASFDLSPVALSNCVDDIDRVLMMDDGLFGGDNQLTREDLAVLKVCKPL